MINGRPVSEKSQKRRQDRKLEVQLIAKQEDKRCEDE